MIIARVGANLVLRERPALPDASLANLDRLAAATIVVWPGFVLLAIAYRWSPQAKAFIVNYVDSPPRRPSSE
ncbi:hypothetical protein FXN61_41460 [Lentzea sp. PSKA42]|uniref:Uncharacterized protein n=1 Tax=Lentzea indica TaxID=2604800 RepID=A0ABX1FWS1_9PSEU|nr:hypothetical protein [Lentzea indica]NKE62848.1 hypothetical protein [Lentzea indica]